MDESCLQTKSLEADRRHMLVKRASLPVVLYGICCVTQTARTNLHERVDLHPILAR